MTKFEAMTTGSSSIELKDIVNTVPNLDRVTQVGFDPEQLVPNRSYVEAGIEKLTALCHAVGMEDRIAEITDIFRAMAVSWGDRSIRDISGWQSDVSDDFSPFEFSIAFKEDRAELRFLLEAQGSEPTLQSNWQAGLDLNQYLAEHFNISFDRFQQIADLFAPTNPDAKLGMWHSVCFFPNEEPKFKLYLNPQSQTKSRSAAVVEESLLRLGFSHAWSNLAEIAAQRGPNKDEFVYLSLDLANHAQARVKVYLRHYDATAADLEQTLSLADRYVAGDATEFCQAMVVGQSLFAAKPVITCFSLVAGDKTTPSNGTIYLPISNYAANDLLVRERLDLYFTRHHLSRSIYQFAIQALATRPLAAGSGMQSYISLRREQQQRRVSIYLNPEVNAVQPPRDILTAALPKSKLSLAELTGHYEEYTIAHHPFLQRLQREPVSQNLIWLLFMNIREAVVNHFTRRLANIIARIDDERIRCVFTKQLNEELGNGDIDRIHRKLFDRLMEVIEPWRMDTFTPEMLRPGQEFSQCLEEIYVDANPYVGVGAAILMEIQGKQFDLCLGQEFRKTEIDLAAISWMTLHEELEIDHADEALVIARYVADSEHGVEFARAGVEKTRVASWQFLDRLYRLCFG